MVDYISVLRSLPNFVKYTDRITFGSRSVLAVYDDSKVADAAQKRGVRCIIRHDLSIDVPMETEVAVGYLTPPGPPDLTALLKDLGFLEIEWSEAPRTNKASVYFFYLSKFHEKEVHHEELVTKRPWFDEVLGVIRKYNPGYTEEMLIDRRINHSGFLEWNASFVANIYPACVERLHIQDPHCISLTLGVAEDDVPACAEKIDGALEKIFALLDGKNHR